MKDWYEIPDGAWTLIEGLLARDDRVRALDAWIRRRQRRLARVCPPRALLTYEERLSERHLVALGMAFWVGYLLGRRFTL